MSMHIRRSDERRQWPGGAAETMHPGLPGGISKVRGGRDKVMLPIGLQTVEERAIHDRRRE
jgi:hypothetical protein